MSENKNNLNNDLEIEDIGGQQPESPRKTGKRGKNLYLVISLACLAVAVIALVYIVRYFAVKDKADEAYESLQAQVVTSNEPSGEPEETPVSTTEPEASTEEPEETEPLEEAMTRVIDFETLQAETNKDIYAWIYIPDTNIDYPVLQHPTDDAHYLNHNLDGSKGYPGCIFTERQNAKDFSDFNTVLYGHNMKNGTMFQNLHKYEDESFLEGHQYVYVYLPDQTLKYQIFAAYAYDDRHLLYSFDYNSDRVREGYLNDIFSMKSLSAVIDQDVQTDADSRIITLSTCIGGQSSNRFLVQAVLLNDINES